MSNEEQIQTDSIANEFFDAITRRDLASVKALYAPEIEVWHNTTKRVQNRDENLALLELFTAKLSGWRYEIHCRDFFPGGFVQRHTLHGLTESGDTIAAPVCIVIHVNNGQIHRIYEYLDANEVAPVLAS